jgi:hypothetical protein
VRERGGKVRLQTIPNITFDTSRGAVHKYVTYVDTDAKTVMADQLRSYDHLAAEFTTRRIDHTKEYVRGAIHTQSMESISPS